MQKLLVISIAAFIVCCNPNQGSLNYQLASMSASNTVLTEVIDETLKDAIYTLETRGQSQNESNQIVLEQLNKIATARTETDQNDLVAIQSYLGQLQALADQLGLSIGFEIAEAFAVGAKFLDPINNSLLTGSIHKLEFEIIRTLSSRIGIIDCCFAGPFEVQTNGVTIATGDQFEMVLFPMDAKDLRGHSTFRYELSEITRGDASVNIESDQKSIGQGFLLEMTPPSPGEYILTFAITEEGKYLENPRILEYRHLVVVQ